MNILTLNSLPFLDRNVFFWNNFSFVCKDTSEFILCLMCLFALNKTVEILTLLRKRKGVIDSDSHEKCFSALRNNIEYNV